MVSMVSGGVGFAPNPVDGLIFFFEPSRPLAATIIRQHRGAELAADEAHAVRDRGRAVVLLGDAVASIGWAAKQPMRRYGVVA